MEHETYVPCPHCNGEGYFESGYDWDDPAQPTYETGLERCLACQGDAMLPADSPLADCPDDLYDAVMEGGVR